MIIVALKHFVYEKALDVLFSGIEGNFMNGTNTAVEVGRTYSCIFIPLEEHKFYGCEVVEVNKDDFVITHKSSTLFDHDINMWVCKYPETGEYTSVIYFHESYELTP